MRECITSVCTMICAFLILDSDLKFMSVFFSKGPVPREESDTKVSFGLREFTVENEWNASASYDPSGNTVSVSISSSPNAPIGLYSLTLDQDGQKTSLGQFVLLFNAWCQSEYMKSFFSSKFCIMVY